MQRHSLSTTHTLTDLPDLLEAARNGSEEALQEACTVLYPRVRGLVHRSLGAELRARPWLEALFSTSDLVQEVFIRVLRDLEQVRVEGDGALTAYLAMLTRNRIIDTIRFHEAARRDSRRVGRNSGRIEAHPDAGDDPAGQAMTLDEVRNIHAALASFSERDRALLRDRIEHGTPFQELSSTLGYASADSARKAFHAAQAKLLARLGRAR